MLNGSDVAVSRVSKSIHSLPSDTYRLSKYHYTRIQLVQSYKRSWTTATYLDVAPPVRAHGARALGEVDLLARESIAELVLVSVTAAVAVESNTSEGVGSLLHLLRHESEYFREIETKHLQAERGSLQRHPSCGRSR